MTCAMSLSIALERMHIVGYQPFQTRKRFEMETVVVIERILGSLPASALTALVATFLAWLTIRNATRRDIDNHKREKLELVTQQVELAYRGHWRMVMKQKDKNQPSTGTKFRPPNENERQEALKLLLRVDFQQALLISKLWIPEIYTVLLDLRAETNRVVDVLNGRSAHPESLMANLTGITLGGNAINAANSAMDACVAVANAISPSSTKQKAESRKQKKIFQVHGGK